MATLPDQAHITDPSRRTRFLVFSSSLRAESFNTRWHDWPPASLNSTAELWILPQC